MTKYSFCFLSFIAISRLVVPRQLIMQQKRFRNRINIQRPQKLFYERALVTEFVTPFYARPEPIKPIWEACTVAKAKSKIEKEIHPYRQIIANEALERFEKSKMVAILHKNSMKAEDSFDFAVALHKKQMTLKYYGPGVMKTAVGGTRFEVISKLLRSPYYFVFGEEPNVTGLQKIVKKTPQVFIMGNGKNILKIEKHFSCFS